MTCLCQFKKHNALIWLIRDKHGKFLYFLIEKRIHNIDLLFNILQKLLYKYIYFLNIEKLLQSKPCVSHIAAH